MCMLTVSCNYAKGYPCITGQDLQSLCSRSPPPGLTKNQPGSDMRGNHAKQPLQPIIFVILPGLCFQKFPPQRVVSPTPSTTTQNPEAMPPSKPEEVKHLPAAASSAELRERFGRFGDLVRCSLAPSGTVGIVQYTDKGRGAEENRVSFFKGTPTSRRNQKTGKTRCRQNKMQSESKHASRSRELRRRDVGHESAAKGNSEITLEKPKGNV